MNILLQRPNVAQQPRMKEMQNFRRGKKNLVETETHKCRDTEDINPRGQRHPQ